MDWELDCEESRVLKNWCFWTVVLEKTPESPLDCKETEPVNPKGDQSWIFIGRTDAEAEAPILWPPDAKSWLIWEDPDAGKDWRQEEKGMTEDEMVGWHHRLNGHESEWIPGVGDGQGGLACCDSWGRKESDMTERLDWTELDYLLLKQQWQNTKTQGQNKQAKKNQTIHSIFKLFILFLILKKYKGKKIVIYFIYHISLCQHYLYN